ncbi:MAG: hypothetical protein QXQ94_01495 [Candidatus Bathyarchaeia archaeon]
MLNLSLKKIKSLTILFLILTSAIAIISFTPRVKAEVTISIEPTHGYVGANVTITANITTSDGQYEILFDGNSILSGTATGTSVYTSIIIPPAPAGSHNITIVDVESEAKENATATFEILTAYLLEVTPLPFPTQQRQEGDSAEFLVNITGGKSNEPYVANITVQTPTNTSYTKMFDILTSDIGSVGTTIKYPDDFRDVSPNANTNFTGEYKVFFNETLATASFTVGLTNSTEYHRFQIVDIKASGYQPEENVTLTITGENLYYSVSLNASTEGVIHYVNWSVPSNARIGTYTVNITSTLNVTVKTPPDVQNFTVPGFDVNITARNLAEEPVPEVAIQIFENESSVVNATSGSDGFASVKLEIGNYTANGYFREKKVGETWVNVTESSLSFDITCNLTNLKVSVLAVVDGNEFLVPEVRLSLSPENLTSTPNLNTNITGAAIFHHLLPNETYTLNASRYDMQFNTTTLYGLLLDGNPIAWFNLTILCPPCKLQVNVTNPNANDQPISNALVKSQEIMGGLNFENTTTTDGTVIFSSPLGKYIVEVYVSGIKINETFVFLNESFINLPISCKFYGLNIKIQVVDYFGQPIPNANVTLSLDGLKRWNLAKSDGIAEFLDAIGGDLQVAVYLPGKVEPYLVSPLHVDSSKTIQIKIERYTILAGFLVETSHLVTSIIIVVSIIVILSLEIYRRKRLKPKTSKSES